MNVPVFLVGLAIALWGAVPLLVALLRRPFRGRDDEMWRIAAVGIGTVVMAAA